MKIQLALLGLELRRPSATEYAEHRRRMAELDSESAKLRREIVGACDPFTGLEWDESSYDDCSL